MTTSVFVYRPKINIFTYKLRRRKRKTRRESLNADEYFTLHERGFTLPHFYPRWRRSPV